MKNKSLLSAAALLFLVFANCNHSEAESSDKKDPSFQTKAEAMFSKDPLQAEAYLKELDPALQKKPWALILRAKCLLIRAEGEAPEQKKASLREVEGLIKDAPNSLKKQVIDHTLKAMQGELIKAISSLETLVKKHPGFQEALLALSHAYLLAGEPKAAMECLYNRIKDHDASPKVRQECGHIIVKYFKDYNTGLNMLRQGVKEAPNLYLAKERLTHHLLNLASDVLNKKEMENTLRVLDEVLALNPDCIPALKMKGQVYSQLKDVSRSYEVFARCYEIDPKDMEIRQCYTRALIGKGYQMLYLKKKEQAHQLFNKAVALDTPGVDLSTVKYLLKGEPYKEKKDDFIRGREFYLKGMDFLKANNEKSALEMFNKSLECIPNQPFALLQKGVILKNAKKFKAAEEALKAAIQGADQMEIKLPQAYLVLAELYIRSKKYTEGEKVLDQHAKRFPDHKDDPIVKGLRRLLLLKD